MRVHTTEEWRSTRKRRIPRYPAEGLVIHHTASSNRTPLPSAQAAVNRAYGIARAIQRYHKGRLKWADIGYNFIITREGVVLEGRIGSYKGAKVGKVVRGAHAGNRDKNRHAWGVALEGNFQRFDIPGEQFLALTALCARLCYWGNVDTALIEGHRDVKSTLCPGDWLYDELDTIRKHCHNIKVGFLKHGLED